MTARDLSFLSSGWATRVGPEFSAPYVASLREFLRQEYSAGKQIFPPKDRIFRALSMVDYNKVRVVILGQDPYHGIGQANGLAFAVEKGVKSPPSLMNIFKEISSDLGVPPPQDPTLLGWAEQGVLLLNTVLTVRAHEAFSHRNQGWEQFTQRVIQELNGHKDPVVFLLWGSPAQSKASLITAPQHLILKAPHPSPLSAYRGFLGCRHFSKANAFLQENGFAPIEWAQTGSRQPA